MPLHRDVISEGTTLGEEERPTDLLNTDPMISSSSMKSAPTPSFVSTGL